MKLCLNTDSLGDLSFEQALDVTAELGIGALEIPAGGHSSAPHMDLAELLADAAARRRFAEAISSRGLSLNAINCSANPLHPRHGDAHTKVIKDSIRLAGELGVGKIVTMSGCPGDSEQARTLNSIWFPWPEEMQAIREEQWEQAIEAWRELAAFAQQHGVARIALEMLPLQLVYNVPTLTRLRDAVGAAIGTNIDPSHMFWQQMDAARVISALGPAVFHVHLKDTELFEDELALNGVLDWRPWDDPQRRAWVFRAVGKGQPKEVWLSILAALDQIGYDDVLSIENEDVQLPGAEGVREAVSFIESL